MDGKRTDTADKRKLAVDAACLKSERDVLAECVRSYDCLIAEIEAFILSTPCESPEQPSGGPSTKFPPAAGRNSAA